MKNKKWICPRCNKTVEGYGATSRRDNETKICSGCGTEEALFDWKISQSKKDNEALPEDLIKEERAWLKGAGENAINC